MLLGNPWMSKYTCSCHSFVDSNNDKMTNEISGLYTCKIIKPLYIVIDLKQIVKDKNGIVIESTNVIMLYVRIS